MTELNDKEKDEISLARMKLKWAIWIFGFAAIILLSQTVFKGMFKWDEEPSYSESTILEESEFVYEPIPFDSTECVNGIHVPTGMVADTGCAEVVQNCGACHSLDLVKQNRATADGWKEIIVWMQETQKLWDLGPKEEVIIKYLAKNYGPENAGRRKNLVITDWYNL